jgi:hypothetical protein
MGDAGVVDEHVDPAKSTDHRVNGALHGIRPRDVALKGKAALIPAVKARHGRLSGLLVHIQHRDVGAVFDGQRGNGGADTHASPSDHRDFVAQLVASHALRAAPRRVLVRGSIRSRTPSPTRL